MPSVPAAPVQRRIGLIVAAVIGVLLVIYVIAALSSGSSARGAVTVGGVDISGLSQEEAAAAVEEATSERVSRPVRIRADGVSFRVTPEDAGLSLDAEASVAPAFGRTWNPITLLLSPFTSQDLPLVAVVDDEALRDSVTQLADAVARAPEEPRIIMRNGSARAKSGEPGQELDVDATMAAVSEAFLLPRAPVTAAIVEVPPSISPEETEQALALARAATSAPVTVQAGTVQTQISGEDIGSALTFVAEDGQLVPRLNGARLHRAIASELAGVETPGRDATFRIRKGVPQVVSSKVGRGVEDDELAAAVAGVIANPPGDRAVTVSVGVREPALTTAEASQLGIRERISTFTQKYPYAAYRSQNIGQAAERINGTLLMPGETFSLNDTILERTVENGYTTGYVVGEGGVFREDLGGGVSASATTTWTAAFFAGMERVQNIAHSIWISRYQPGLEATVAWGIFDLKFRNDSPNAVFITASTTPTSMTVSFWGTPQYERIEAEFGPRTGIVPFSKIFNEDPECKPQSGIDGFTITVDRVFYQDGAEVRREPITTRYKPAPQVVCGEKPKKKKGQNRPGQQSDEFTGEDAAPGSDPSASASPEADGSTAEASARPDRKPTEKPDRTPSRNPDRQPSEPGVFSN